MTYTVVLVREEDGRYSAYVPAIPGCMTWGETRPEAVRMAREAIGEFLAMYAEEGRSLPMEGSTLSFELDDARKADVCRVDLQETPVGKPHRGRCGAGGSHVILSRGSCELCVPVHSDRPLPEGLLARLVKHAGLTVEEFIELLKQS